MQVKGDAEVKGKFSSTGDALSNLQNRSEAAAQSATRVQFSYRQAALSTASAASAAAGLFFQYDNLEKVALRVEKAQVTLSSAQASLAASQVTLNNLVEKGETGGDRYNAAMLRLKTAQERVSVATQDVSIAQGDLSESQAQFALSVVPTVLESVSSMGSAMSGMRGAIAASAAATTVQRTVNLGSIGSFTALTGATVGHTVATKAATVATKLLHLAMGPIGLAILGVSTFMALFATNAFGIRDAINAAGKAIGDAVPVLRPLLDMLGGIANAIFPQAAEEAQDFSTRTTASFQQAAAQAGDLQAATSASFSNMTDDVGTGVTMQTQAMANLSMVTQNASASMSGSFDGMGDDAERAATRISAAAKKAAAALKKLGLAKSRNAGDADFKAAATGFSGVVSRPTIFLAGEAGPERVNIAPVGAARGAGSRPIVITVVTQLDGREVARTVSRHQSEGLG